MPEALPAALMASFALSYLVGIRVDLLLRKVSQEAHHGGDRDADHGSHLGPVAAKDSEHVNLGKK